MSLLKHITVPAKKAHTHTILFLHGLGDSGDGWSQIVGEMAPHLPYAKWIFPHAPYLPVTLNAGMRCPAWYDIRSLDKSDPDEDEAGLRRTISEIEKLIQVEINAGIKSENIVLGGFSQGGAVSLLSSFLLPMKLGGFICLSGYLPLGSKVQSIKNDINSKTKIFQAHGNADPVVAFEWGLQTKDYLSKIGLNVEFKVYNGMPHSSSAEEMRDMLNFLKEITVNQ